MDVISATAPRRRLAPEARREQILEVAVAIFGTRPYAEVSTGDIARKAGVARGLLNHYFGTKRDLYLEVVRRMVLPDIDHEVITPTGPLEARVSRSVAWFLDAVSEHGQTFVRVIGPEGVAADAEVERIVAAADDLAARVVLVTIGAADIEDPRHRAAVRAYGGLVKAAAREWIGAGTLSRDQVHLLLSQALIAIVRDVLPHLSEGNPA